MNRNSEIKAYGALPNERQMDWYKRRLTAFLHFGMNTFTGREWGDGTESPELFNPTELSCEQWIKALKDAGFGVAILTAKHHDGFCLWPSKYTEHSVKNSPFRQGRGDIVREFTDACRKYGVKPGIYLSPWDRHEKSWGTDAYNDFYANQLTELLTGYGEIFEVWWDGAGSTEANYDWERWQGLVRKYAPRAVIFGSLGATPYVDVRWVGNELGYAGVPCYATIDESSLYKEIIEELNTGKINGERFIPAEVDVSIRPGWFYHAEQDSAVRTPRNLLRLWLSSVGRGAGLLLNIPPDRRGLLHENDVSSILEMKRMIDENEKSNLLKDAIAEASSTLSDKYSANNTLSSDETLLYSSKEGDKTPEIVFTLKRGAKVSAVELCEAVELGQRITSFEIDGLVNGEWTLLAEGRSMGYTSILTFERRVCEKIRLRITGAVKEPVIKTVRAFDYSYFADDSVPQGSSGNLLDSPLAELNCSNGEIDIQLGGIYPFNCLRIDGRNLDSYEVYIFNGTSFDFAYSEQIFYDEQIIHRFEEVIDWAYRLKIKLSERNGGVENRKVELFLEER